MRGRWGDTGYGVLGAKQGSGGICRVREEKGSGEIKVLLCGTMHWGTFLWHPAPCIVCSARGEGQDRGYKPDRGYRQPE